MNTLTLLIADNNDEFRFSLSNALQGTYRVFSCTNGQDAFQILKKDSPDIMVLDLMLPELDGITLLHRAAESGLCPMVLATTPLITDYIVDSMEQIGVGYLLHKPCEIKAVVSRIHDLSQRIHRAEGTAPDSMTQVSNMLISLGISTKLSGYTYLREAVLLMADSPLQSVTKELYPTVGGKCGHSAAHVERSIRTAIGSAWAKRDERVWRQFFQEEAGGNIRRPTNAVFITNLSQRILLDQMYLNLP